MRTLWKYKSMLFNFKKIFWSYISFFVPFISFLILRFIIFYFKWHILRNIRRIVYVHFSLNILFAQKFLCCINSFCLVVSGLATVMGLQGCQREFNTELGKIENFLHATRLKQITCTKSCMFCIFKNIISQKYKSRNYLQKFSI